MDVKPRPQQDVAALGVELRAQRLPPAIAQVSIPGRRHRQRRGEGRDLSDDVLVRGPIALAIVLSSR